MTPAPQGSGRPELLPGKACPYPGLPPPVRVPLVVVPDHPCPYLPGRLARTRAFAAETLPPQLYHDFMDAAFRRSGDIFYQPVCSGCRACMPLRVPVDRFRPSRSQRRCRARNADLTCAVGEPQPTQEKFDLYTRYVAARHSGPMNSDDREAFESFLYHSPVRTLEICHRDADGRLMAVGICDICPRSLSTVYFFFEPAESRRSLGTFGALVEIELARQMGIPHYYLGYWVSGARTMDYKSTFRPCEVLHADGAWRPLPPDDSTRATPAGLGAQ